MGSQSPTQNYLRVRYGQAFPLLVGRQQNFHSAYVVRALFNNVIVRVTKLNLFSATRSSWRYLAAKRRRGRCFQVGELSPIDLYRHCAGRKRAFFTAFHFRDLFK